MSGWSDYGFPDIYLAPPLPVMRGLTAALNERRRAVDREAFMPPEPLAPATQPIPRNWLTAFNTARDEIIPEFIEPDFATTGETWFEAPPQWTRDTLFEYLGETEILPTQTPLAPRFWSRWAQQQYRILNLLRYTVVMSPFADRLETVFNRERRFARVSVAQGFSTILDYWGGSAEWSDGHIEIINETTHPELVQPMLTDRDHRLAVYLAAKYPDAEWMPWDSSGFISRNSSTNYTDGWQQCGAVISIDRLYFLFINRSEFTCPPFSLRLTCRQEGQIIQERNLPIPATPAGENYRPLIEQLAEFPLEAGQQQNETKEYAYTISFQDRDSFPRYIYARHDGEFEFLE